MCARLRSRIEWDQESTRRKSYLSLRLEGRQDVYMCMFKLNGGSFIPDFFYFSGSQ